MATIKTKTDPSKDLTIHTVTGDITAEELLSHINAFYLSEKPTKNALWDFTEAEYETITGDQIMKIAQVRKKFDKIRKGGKTALVFSGDVGYGLGRMFEAHAQFVSLSTQQSIFYSVDEALEWLAS